MDGSVEGKEVAKVEELNEREIALAMGEDPEAVLDETPGDAGAEDAGTAEVGQEAEVAAEQPDGGKEAAAWYGDDDLKFAESYGLTEEDLGTFESQVEFQKAARLLDKIQHGKPTVEETETEEPAPKPTSHSASEDLELDPQRYVDLDYDEETVHLVRYTKQLRDQLNEVRATMAAQEAARQEREQQQFIDTFHATVDTMDSELYGRTEKDGKPAKLDKEVDDNRRKLFETAVSIHSTLAAQGRAPSLPVLLRRAEAVAFGERILERDRKRYTEKLAEQSRKRRRVAGNTRPTGAPAPATKTDEDVVNHPAIVKLWEQMQEEAGV